MRASLFIGRYQPLHEGHKKLIQVALDEGKPVVVGLMDTAIDTSNPYSIDERRAMFAEAFGDNVKCIVIPPIDEVCFGRNVGYWPRRIYLDADTEEISATKIRDDIAAGDVDITFNDKAFIEAWNRVAVLVHELSVSQGFWRDGANRNKGEVIALAHSELSEALECFRERNKRDKNIYDMTGGEVQLSDVLGILLDMSAGYGLKIAEALMKKMEFNKGRGWMHGNKKF